MNSVAIIRAPVLVLNQNYQPLNICDVRRAVSLLGRGKAESVQESGEYIHTVDDIFEKPDVIRLIYYVKRPLHRRRLSRREVFLRDRHRCQYCGTRNRDLTLDHVLPRSRGGQHIWENVVSACKKCNHGKAGRTPREAGMRLRNKPVEPRPNPYAVFHHDRVRPQWRQFMPWMEEDDDLLPVGYGVTHADFSDAFAAGD